MGLDMYLNKTKRKDYESKTFSTENVYYWRKANAIHGWFVDNVQNGEDDCDVYKVTKEKLLELVQTINLVLKGKTEEERIELAKEYLPVRTGFFYGSYTYDICYFDTLKETEVVLGRILNKFDFDKEILLYESSW